MVAIFDITLGCLYLSFGLLGFVANFSIILLILTIPTYRKPAYIIMANIAIADAVMCLVMGCYIGLVLFNIHYMVEWMACFMTVTSWFVLILTYGVLAINRCITTCYARRPWATKFNLLKVAVCVCVVIWLIAIVIGTFCSYPTPMYGFKIKIFTMTYNNGIETNTIKWIQMAINCISVTLQWICSSIVIRKIHVTRRNATRHERNGSFRARNNSRKQVRLVFQFFYPSIICILSSLLLLSISSLYVNGINVSFCIISHFLSLSIHMCNPFIYYYLNPNLRHAALSFCCTRPAFSSSGTGLFGKTRSQMPLCRTRSLPVTRNRDGSRKFRPGSFLIWHPSLRPKYSSTIRAEVRKWADLNRAIAEVVL